MNFVKKIFNICASDVADVNAAITLYVFIIQHIKLL
jgi:hypothetical protein